MADVFDVSKMIGSINEHVPVTRRSITEILETGENTYKAKNGEIFEMDAEEIVRLAEYCTEMEKMRIRLPIFVSTDTSGDGMAWKVDGAAESKVVAKILDKPQYRSDSVRFYHPDYRSLLCLFPTTFIVLFLP